MQVVPLRRGQVRHVRGCRVFVHQVVLRVLRIWRHRHSERLDPVRLPHRRHVRRRRRLTARWGER
jgi:hypothetical protein